MLSSQADCGSFGSSLGVVRYPQLLHSIVGELFIHICAVVPTGDSSFAHSATKHLLFG